MKLIPLVLFFGMLIFMNGCLTSPPESAEDKAAKLAQQQALDDSPNASARAERLKEGMTPNDAQSTLQWQLILVSSTNGAMGKCETYKTDVWGGYPNVWLTFYNGALQTWTVIPQR